MNPETNLFESLPDNLASEVCEDIVRSSAVRIERIISKGHRTPENDWYDQDENEWVLVVQGEASLVFEDGTRCDLSAGDYVNIPAHVKHRVAWTAPEHVTIWLAVFYQ